MKVIEQFKQAVNTLNQKNSNLEQEKYNIARQKDQTIDILNKELNKGVNINYLRSIVISFLTTKEENVNLYFLFVQIQDTLLPVIYTALQFNESEIKKVNEARIKKSGGLLDYFKK